MKTTLYIIVLMLSFFLISCNRREKQLEKRLVEMENSFNKSNEDLYKSLLDVQNLIEENEKLKNEIDELQSKNEKIKKWNQELIVENNNLKNENDNLTNKQKAKIVSVKKQAEPSYTPKAIDHNKVTNKIENKNIVITNNEIKSFLSECKKPLKEIQDYLLRLRNADLKPLKSKRKLGDFWYGMQISSRDSNRRVYCRIIVNESTKLHYKITRKLKNLPEDNSTIQYRKMLNSIDHYLKIVIDCCKIHTQLTTKGEMDTYTTSALQAMEKINSIINNFQ